MCILIGFLLCVGLVLSGTAVAGDQGKPISTNKDKLLTLAVQGQIAPAEPGRSYATTWDGKPKMAIGIGGINYNLKIGDMVFGWAAGDRTTVGVATVGKGEDRFRSAWLNYASIGNEVKILNGDAKGKKGVVIGKFERYVLVHFDDAVLEKLAIDNTIQAKACGVGLEIEGFDDVFIHGLDPMTLEKMGITIADGQLVVPVVLEVPGHIMGSGIGWSFIEALDYDIQTTDPKTAEELGLKKLRLGDLVAIRDHYDFYGNGRYEGAVTIGVCIHGWSDMAGHGPGLNPILSALPGRIKTRIDPHENTAYYLGIKPKPRD